MALADFSNLVGGVPVARSDLAQIFARHAIEPVDGCAVVASGARAVRKMASSRIPSRVRNGHAGAVQPSSISPRNHSSRMCWSREKMVSTPSTTGRWWRSRSQSSEARIALRVGQGVVVADQDDSGVGYFAADIAGGENLLVGAVGLAKIAKILASGGGIDGANLTLDAGNSVELGGTAPRS